MDVVQGIDQPGRIVIPKDTRLSLPSRGASIVNRYVEREGELDTAFMREMNSLRNSYLKKLHEYLRPVAEA